MESSLYSYIKISNVRSPFIQQAGLNKVTDIKQTTKPNNWPLQYYSDSMFQTPKWQQITLVHSNLNLHSSISKTGCMPQTTWNHWLLAMFNQKSRNPCPSRIDLGCMAYFVKWLPLVPSRQVTYPALQLPPTLQLPVFCVQVTNQYITTEGMEYSCWRINLDSPWY